MSEEARRAVPPRKHGELPNPEEIKMTPRECVQHILDTEGIDGILDLLKDAGDLPRLPGSEEPEVEEPNG